MLQIEPSLLAPWIDTALVTRNVGLCIPALGWSPRVETPRILLNDKIERFDSGERNIPVRGFSKEKRSATFCHPINFSTSVEVPRRTTAQHHHQDREPI